MDSKTTHMINYLFNFGKRLQDGLFVKTCQKRSDNTTIKVVRGHVWTDHFCKKFAENEPFTNLKMKSLLPKLKDGSFIVDVGAHVGDTGLYLAHHLQKSYEHKNIDVIMIEPDEIKTEFIRKMIALNDLQNCVAITCGVSDKRRAGTLLVNHEFPGATLVDEYDVHGEIPIETVDRLCQQLNVSMMHIDVEGMEHKCLMGSKHTLENVQYVVIEMNEIPSRPNEEQPPPSNRDNERTFLKDHGFAQIEDPDMYAEYNNELYVKRETVDLT